MVRLQAPVRSSGNVVLLVVEVVEVVVVVITVLVVLVVLDVVEVEVVVGNRHACTPPR